MRVRIENSNAKPIFIQIDPFAALYRLKEGESLEIEPSADSTPTRIEVDESGDTRFVTLPDSVTYFVISEGRRIPWTEFQTNIDDE